MKVLIVDNYPAPYRVDLYNLIAKEVDLTVIYNVDKDTTRDQKYKNSNMKYKSLYFSGIRVGTTTSISFKIRRYLKSNKFDIILIGGYSYIIGMQAIRYLHKKNIPFILNADGGFLPKSENFIKKAIKKYFISKATIWITSGKATDAYLEYYGADKNRIYHYPFAFHFSNRRYKPTEQEKIDLKKELGIIHKQNILYVGRLMEIKRLQDLLKAYSMLKGDIGLYIVGNNNLTAEYIKLIRECDIKNVYCVGFKSALELDKYYRASDLFVLPSNGEVWGLVINEALLNSCPVITTYACNAGLELIENMKNGVLIPPCEPNKLYEKIQYLLDNPTVRENISNNAYERIEDFNIENNKRRHLEIFQNFYNEYINKK